MSKSAAQLLSLIRAHRLRFFSTADVLTLTGMTPTSATHALQRMEAQKLTTRIRRGLWVNRLIDDINPYEAVPYLRAPWPAYVSLYSALADYGVVEEIPQVIYAVSAARPKQYRTPIGSFYIHHLPPHLMWGYDMKKVGQGSYLIAEPEKAFLDLAYLALIPRSPLQFPHKRGKRWKLDKSKIRKYAVRFKFQPLVEYLKQSGA